MTLDETIKQFKKDAEYNRVDLDLEWAEENEQVAKWLEELKAIKESAVFYSNRPIEDIVLEARNDMAKEIYSNLMAEISLLTSSDMSKENLYKFAHRVTEFAEQLKEQGK